MNKRIVSGLVLMLLFSAGLFGHPPSMPLYIAGAGLLFLLPASLLIWSGMRARKQVSGSLEAFDDSSVLRSDPVFQQRVDPDKPIEIDSKWNPGAKLTLMSYTEAVSALTSGEPKRMAEAIGSNILNAPKQYNDVSTSLNCAAEETLTGLLLPLLKHEEYSVRCCIPGVLEEIGDAHVIPYLEEVMQHDRDSQVAKNARIAIDTIKSRTANIDSVKLVRRYTKPIPGETTSGTYEEYAAPNKAVARAFLATKTITQDYFYIEVVTPEGNLGKDKLGLFGEAKVTIITVRS